MEATVSLDNDVQLRRKEDFFIIVVGRDGNRLPREVTDIPSLAAFKVRSRIGL